MNGDTRVPVDAVDDLGDEPIKKEFSIDLSHLDPAEREAIQRTFESLEKTQKLAIYQYKGLEARSELQKLQYMVTTGVAFSLGGVALVNDFAVLGVVGLAVAGLSIYQYLDHREPTPPYPPEMMEDVIDDDE